MAAFNGSTSVKARSSAKFAELTPGERPFPKIEPEGY